MGPDLPALPKDQVRALRELLGMTQQQLADASEVLSRTDVVKVETGANQASSDRVRTGLATALGLERADLGRLLTGELSPTQASKRSRARGARPTGGRGRKGAGETRATGH